MLNCKLLHVAGACVLLIGCEATESDNVSSETFANDAFALGVDGEDKDKALGMGAVATDDNSPRANKTRAEHPQWTITGGDDYTLFTIENDRDEKLLLNCSGNGINVVFSNYRGNVLPRKNGHEMHLFYEIMLRDGRPMTYRTWAQYSDQRSGWNTLDFLPTMAADDFKKGTALRVERNEVEVVFFPYSDPDNAFANALDKCSAYEPSRI